MGQALYRKYRSTSLDELVGQEHITKTLATAIKSGRIAHAYLFTGPRGVGKTSTARILAYAINGLDYSQGQSHLDIVEIDAASNNSVEDIRDLREKVYVAPSTGKYKVYIIDEVHMLSKAAFNAILKTLEEPPAHAVFILATTEAHKLPETIVSRTQRFVFRPIAPEKAVAHLRTIAQAENIDVTDEALQLLAAMGDGSFRDSISLLDQASGLGKTIDVTDVQQLLGVPTAENILQLVEALTQPPIDLQTVLPVLYGLYDQGYQAAAIASELSNQLRQRIIGGTLVPAQQHLALLAKLLEVPSRPDPERYLEIILLGLGETAPLPSPEEVTKPKPAATTPTAVRPSQPAPKTVKKNELPKLSAPETRPDETPARPAKGSEPETASPSESTESHSLRDAKLWPQVLAELKKQYNTLYGIIRMAAVSQPSGDTFELRFAFAFHQKRVNEAKNRKIISDIIEQLSGQKVHISCLYDASLKGQKVATLGPLPPVPDHKTAAATASGSLATISNIFGGGELLQS